MCIVGYTYTIHIHYTYIHYTTLYITTLYTIRTLYIHYTTLYTLYTLYHTISHYIHYRKGYGGLGNPSPSLYYPDYTPAKAANGGYSAGKSSRRRYEDMSV